MRSPRLIIITSLALLLVTTGCALANYILDTPTPTPEPQRALRPTFTPTATSPDKPPKTPIQPQPLAAEPDALANVNPPALVATEPVIQDLSAMASPEEAPAESAGDTSSAEAVQQPAAAPIAIVEGDEVRARSGPGTDYDQVGTLRRGDQFQIVARHGGELWWQICCIAGQPAWVFGDLVSVQGPTEAVALAENMPPPTPTPVPTATATPLPTATPEPQALVVVSNPRVNVRRGPSTDFGILGQVTQGTRLEVVGRNQNDSWWQVCCVEGQEGWITGDLVRTEGPIEEVALAAGLPTATPRPTPTVAAALAASSEGAQEPTVEPGDLPFELSESTTFDFANNDFFRVAVKVADADNSPLGGYYLRVRNETTGQEWLSRQTGDYAWEYSAPNEGFADFREINLQFDTNGKAPLTGNRYVVWLVNRGGEQVGASVQHQPDDDELAWLYIAYVLQ